MLAQPGVGPRPVGRFEQQLDRPVELGSRPFEVPELQLALTGEEALLRGVNQNGNGIGRGDLRNDHRRRRHGRWRRRGIWGLGLLDPQAAVNAVTKLVRRLPPSAARHDSTCVALRKP